MRDYLDTVRDDEIRLTLADDLYRRALGLDICCTETPGTNMASPRREQRQQQQQQLQRLVVG